MKSYIGGNFCNRANHPMTGPSRWEKKCAYFWTAGKGPLWTSIDGSLNLVFWETISDLGCVAASLLWNNNKRGQMSYFITFFTDGYRLNLVNELFDIKRGYARKTNEFLNGSVKILIWKIPKVNQRASKTMILGLNCWFGRGVYYTRCSDRAALFLETQRSQRVSLSPRLLNKVDVHLELMADKCTPYLFVVLSWDWLVKVFAYI